MERKNKVEFKECYEFVADRWKNSIKESMEDYIRIPCTSPMFDEEYATNGLIDQAVDLLVNWVKQQNVPDLKISVRKDGNRSPVIFMEVEGEKDSEVFMYGHMDKQPPMTEAWSPGLGPWLPVVRDGKLYGRGAADDGYSTYAAVTSIKYLKENNIPIGRTVILIEAAEESGSPDLTYYFNAMAKEIGNPSLLICLDSGCGNYEAAWLTTSLRGMACSDLKVSIVTEGMHSGAASGIVPSSFRVLRTLLDRIEDPATGVLKCPEAFCEISPAVHASAKKVTDLLGDEVWNRIPLVKGATPITHDLTELYLNRTYRPTLCITGLAGVPDLKHAASVLREHTTVRLSIRLPPLCQPEAVHEWIKKEVTTNVPYGAKVEYTPNKSGEGWAAPPLSPWLHDSLNEVSNAMWNTDYYCHGEGGSIPFMAMLGRRFPSSNFLATGVLGPGSNAHGPNEYLHIDYFKRVVVVITHIVASNYVNTASSGSAAKKQKTSA